MIARLRRAHPWALFTPLTLVGAGLLWLGPRPAFEEQTPLSRGPQLPAAAPGAEFFIDLAGGELIALRTWPADGDRGRPLIEVAWPAGVPQPEVLVYSGDSAGLAGALPPDARLVGALGSGERSTFLWPADAGPHLILFDLVHQDILGGVKLR
jgi:hypothetical protein